MLNMNDKFNTEHPTVSVSYTTFKKRMSLYAVASSVTEHGPVKCRHKHN